MIRLTVIVIEFCAFADTGEPQQQYAYERFAAKLVTEHDLLEIFRIYVGDALLIALFFPYNDPEKENIPQMLPCQN